MTTRISPRDYTLDRLARWLIEDGLLTERQRVDLQRNESRLREKVLRRRTREGATRRVARYEVSPAELIASVGYAASDGTPLTEDRIMQVVAERSGLSWLKLDPLRMDEKLITSTMSRPFARRHVCMPVARGDDGLVTFAVDNPFDLELQGDLRTLLPRGYNLVVSAKSDILRIITDVYGFRAAVSKAEADLDGGTDLGNLEQLVKLTAVEDIEANDKHVVNAVEYLLHYAFEQRASDIHLEPKREESQIRLRIDGVLHTIYRAPRTVHKAMVSRIKTMSRLDIAERRRPQDGRFKTKAGQRETEMRVSTLPVAFGEKVVLRIFDPSMLMQDIEGLGFFEGELRGYREMIGRTTGLVLVTGPTGSGKTTTLYSTLRLLAGPEVNVTTVEDPVEMVFEPFNQTAVNKRIDLDFATALRTVLRQDPDIVMIGEIRDSDTASMAVQAALTGHLVFSTVHTNDAPSAVTRLQDLGVPNFLISSVLAGVIAQRLVRKVCTACRTETRLTAEQAALLGIHMPPGQEQDLPVWYGAGCPTCRNTGLRGRTGLFEVMPIDSGIRRLVTNGADAAEIRAEATANGMSTLREAAIRKLALGQTSFEEIVRVLGES